MYKSFKKIFSFVLLTLASIFAHPTTVFAITDTEHLHNLVKQSHLDPKIIELALKARKWAKAHTKINKNILAVVNYKLPASAKRLYVFDLKHDQLIMNIQVAHGSGSGGLIATQFSNRPQSKMSVLGTLVTGQTYYGHHGKSMRLIGLEPGINDKAMSRAIVIHAAPYVNPQFVRYHRNLGIGRSWGCLAVSQSDLAKLIKVLGHGAPIFSYSDPELHDRYLNREHLS